MPARPIEARAGIDLPRPGDRWRTFDFNPGRANRLAALQRRSKAGPKAPASAKQAAGRAPSTPARPVDSPRSPEIRPSRGGTTLTAARRLSDISAMATRIRLG